MSINIHGFVDWKEQFVSQERGNRVVHYYLKDTAGESVLAVVGTERSVRHMVYVVADDFLQVYGSERFINAGFKWRSRREVVDWLTSLVSRRPPRDCSKSPKDGSPQAVRSADFISNGRDGSGAHLFDHIIARKLKGHSSDIFWSGDYWTCSKQLKHYPAFWRNGITISVHSFVYVMGKEENRYLGYLEDMYEDRKGLKKVKVRWFHDNQEVQRVISLRNPRPGEVFITPHVQVISAECVDGPATVLTPEHHERSFAILFNLPSSRINICDRQFKGSRVTSFDLTKLRGYSEQAILSCLEEEDFNQDGNVKQGAKKTRSCRGRQKFFGNQSGVRMSGQGSHMTGCEPTIQNLRFGFSSRRPLAVRCQDSISPSFKVDEKIEFLCQDSGIRGCWFRCTILQVLRKKVNVQYDDVQDADGCGNLEEWIPASRVANPDKLGLRCSDRFTIRPRPPSQDLTDDVFEIGSSFDAWWNDGWWEGVVTEIGSSSNDSVQVYFPGENVFSTFKRSDLRVSRDWVRDCWVDIEAKSDILSAISAAVSPGMKLSACSAMVKGTESGNSAMSLREVPITFKLDTVEEDRQELTVSPISSDHPDDVKPRKRPRVEIEDQAEAEETDGNETDGNETDEGNMRKTYIEEDVKASGHKSDAEYVEVVVGCMEVAA